MTVSDDLQSFLRSTCQIRTTVFFLSEQREPFGPIILAISFSPPEKEPIESVDTIPESIGHHAEWIEAIKNGSATDATTCNFEYSGRLAETVLLGPLSYRCNESLEYDSAKMEITNSSRATQYLNAVYRDGWGLDF